MEVKPRSYGARVTVQSRASLEHPMALRVVYDARPAEPTTLLMAEHAAAQVAEYFETEAEKSDPVRFVTNKDEGFCLTPAEALALAAAIRRELEIHTAAKSVEKKVKSWS